MAKGKGAIRWLALAGVVGPILFIALFTLAGLLRPGYSAIRDAISDLGIGPNAWIQNANFTLSIIVSVALGATLFRRANEELGEVAATAKPGDQRLIAIQRRVATLNVINVLVLLSAVWAMVFKPTQ
jgi:hypothetical protein